MLKPLASASVESTETERILARVLADVLGVERVPVDAHFFDEMGADSLLMAKFCARVRTRRGLPSISIREVYRHPTIRALAASLEDAARGASAFSTAPAVEPATRTSAIEYALCGTMQLLFFLGYSYVAMAGIIKGYIWVTEGSGALAIYLR